MALEVSAEQPPSPQVTENLQKLIQNRKPLHRLALAFRAADSRDAGVAVGAGGEAEGVTKGDGEEEGGAPSLLAPGGDEEGAPVEPEAAVPPPSSGEKQGIRYLSSRFFIIIVL